MNKQVTDVRVNTVRPTCNIADIELKDGTIQRPTWRSLAKYWPYAWPRHLDYVDCTWAGHLVAFYMTVAAGQGGRICIWNGKRHRWEQLIEADYVISALILLDLNAIVTLHYVSCYGVPGHHQLWATTLRHCLGVDRTTSVELTTSSPTKLPSAPDTASTAHPPQANEPSFGLFTKEEILVANDSGNRYTVSLKDIHTALRASAPNTERHVTTGPTADNAELDFEENNLRLDSYPEIRMPAARSKLISLIHDSNASGGYGWFFDKYSLIYGLALRGTGENERHCLNGHRVWLLRNDKHRLLAAVSRILTEAGIEPKSCISDLSLKIKFENDSIDDAEKACINDFYNNICLGFITVLGTIDDVIRHLTQQDEPDQQDQCFFEYALKPKGEIVRLIEEGVWTT